MQGPKFKSRLMTSGLTILTFLQVELGFIDHIFSSFFCEVA
jgi:hypothetical protein